MIMYSREYSIRIPTTLHKKVKRIEHEKLVISYLINMYAKSKMADQTLFNPFNIIIK